MAWLSCHHGHHLTMAWPQRHHGRFLACLGRVAIMHYFSHMSACFGLPPSCSCVTSVIGLKLGVVNFCRTAQQIIGVRRLIMQITVSTGHICKATRAYLMTCHTGRHRFLVGHYNMSHDIAYILLHVYMYVHAQHSAFSIAFSFLHSINQ